MLPQVKPEIFDAKVQSYKDRNVQEFFDTLRVENPHLYDYFVATMKNQDITAEFKEGFANGFTQVYDMLKAQDECDELTRQIGDFDEQR